MTFSWSCLTFALLMVLPGVLAEGPAVVPTSEYEYQPLPLNYAGNLFSQMNMTGDRTGFLFQCENKCNSMTVSNSGHNCVAFLYQELSSNFTQCLFKSALDYSQGNAPVTSKTLYMRMLPNPESVFQEETVEWLGEPIATINMTDVQVDNQVHYCESYCAYSPNTTSTLCNGFAVKNNQCILQNTLTSSQTLSTGTLFYTRKSATKNNVPTQTTTSSTSTTTVTQLPTTMPHDDNGNLANAIAKLILSPAPNQIGKIDFSGSSQLRPVASLIVVAAVFFFY